MDVNDFRENLLTHFDRFRHALATDVGDWVVKGFIDVYRNIYTLSADTKVVSKVIELLLFPVISQFAAEHGYKIVLSEHQNYYPDISFIYWMNYLTEDMARAIDSDVPYRNLEEYWEWRERIRRKR